RGPSGADRTPQSRPGCSGGVAGRRARRRARPRAGRRSAGRRGWGGWGPAQRHVAVPDVAPVPLAGRRTPRDLRVLRLDDALPVQILADLVPGSGEAGAVQDHRRGPADPAAKRRQRVEESVVLGSDVFLVDDELHARHRVVLSGPRRSSLELERTGQSLAGPGASVNAAGGTVALIRAAGGTHG